MIALVALFVACALGAPYQPTVVANDIAILNYALFLERFEATFYNIFQTRYTKAQFAAAGANPNLYDHLETIRAHENAHVAFLESFLGAAAIPNCTRYNFAAITSIQSYVVTAKVIENVGVSAYDGAVNSISDRQLASVAATIATVEARHASYLNNISTNFPAEAAFTGAFDEVRTRDQVNAIVATFSPECQVPLPTFTSINIAPADAVITFANNTVVTGVSQAYLNANDVKILQYALVLEHLEDAFYQKYNALFDSAAFVSANIRNATLVSAYMRLIGAHETIHVDTLSGAIGAAALPGCGTIYNWTAILNKDITTVADFLLASSKLEAAGVGAYDYAISSIYSKAYQQVAASIATIEARHSAFVNDIINPTDANAPFPANRDTALAFNAVATAVLPILSTCYNGAQILQIQFDDIRTLVSVNTSSTSAASTSSTSASASTSTASTSSVSISTSTSSTASSTAASTTTAASTGTTGNDASSVVLSVAAIFLAVAAML